MTVPDTQICEAKIEGLWQSLSVDEAYAHYRMAPKRCPACHGSVITRSSYVPPIKIGLSHRKAHDGCPLLPMRFTGTPSPHPQAVD